MFSTATHSKGNGARNTSANRRDRWFAAGGLAGAALAASCCIAPLVLILLGVSGAWIGALTALEPYKPWFVGAALIFLTLGFGRVYFGPDRVCEEDAACACRGSSQLTKGALWSALVLVGLAMTIEWWAPVFY